MSAASAPPGAVNVDIATPAELKQFVEAAGDSLLVIDVRSAEAEEDVTSIARTALPSSTAATTTDNNNNNYRPRAINLVWDRSSDSMPLPDDVVPKHTPIITHCGAGKRGKMAKDYLMKHGFTKVVNGGGPKETACWNEFGDK